MAEGTYEYEVMKAELLGLDKPDYEEFMKRKKERQEAQEEELEIEQITELEDRQEDLIATSGKLDELNNILAATQKKLDRFKVRCGSISDLIRTKISGISGTVGEPSTPPPEGGATASAPDTQTISAEPGNGEAIQPAPNNRKSDLTRALDNNVDKLDQLLDKTENAHFSMSEQNKQMKRYL